MDAEQVLIDAPRLREVMALGGRAEITVRSLKSDQHVRVTLAAKKRGEDGRFISRAKSAGRVGTEDADVIFANDPARDFMSSGLAKLCRTGKFAGRIFKDTQDANRAWTAQMLLQAVTGEREDFPESAEVFLASKCCACGKTLSDPESIIRGIGPECRGKSTGSKALPQQMAVIA